MARLSGGGSAAVYFFVLLIDAGISLDGARARTDQLQERGKVSLVLVKHGWVGGSRANLLNMTKCLEKYGVIVMNHPEAVEVGEIVFSISDDEVVDVRYMDGLMPEQAGSDPTQ